MTDEDLATKVLEDHEKIMEEETRDLEADEFGTMLFAKKGDNLLTHPMESKEFLSKLIRFVVEGGFEYAVMVGEVRLWEDKADDDQEIESQEDMKELNKEIKENVEPTDNYMIQIYTPQKRILALYDLDMNRKMLINPDEEEGGAFGGRLMFGADRYD